jgi:phospholipid/cholesterol/gamma-HCH transport system substrate-binding protein
MSSTFRLGMFIVASFLILAVAVFLVGSRTLAFGSTFRVKAEFQNVAGLDNGADVRIGGIHEGTVKAIDLPKRPSDKIVVEIELKKEARDVVRRDSVTSIDSEGLVGDKYVEISFGSPDAERVVGGETIESHPPVDVSDVINKTNQILDTTKDAVKNIQATSGSLKSITSKIDDGQGTAGKLINDNTIYEQATQSVTSLRESMEALKT